MPPKGADVPKEFRCAATGKPLYMPVITTQGIAYSYAALFEMFTKARGVPTCKVTKEPIMFFPSVCLPLHHFLMDEYRGAMRNRKATDEEELAGWGFHMPLVNDAPERDTDDGLLEELECVVSQELVYEPCVLSSGSIVSAYCVPQGGFKRDPDRLIACALHGQAPRKSDVLEAMIRARFPQQYNERALELAKEGIQTEGKHANGTCAEFSPDVHIFWGLGCDGCGLWPIRGGAWEDEDCPEGTGFHLCDACYRYGFQKRVISGKFNQTHMPKHKMVPMLESDYF